MSLFSAVELAPRDPILGLTEAFNADDRPHKVNLGVGVYADDEGRLPLLRSAYQAEQTLLNKAAAHGYLPIDGLRVYNQAVQKLILGEASPLLAQGRMVTVQTLGGTGALKVGADFLKRILPNAQVALSNPSWENHAALFTSAGFEVVNYPYYDAATHALDIEGFLAALNTYAKGTIVVLHACCHNPTGVDLTLEQWQKVAAIVQERQLVPFLDMAYQGFGVDLQSDAAAVRLFAEAGIPSLIANSFSKTFSLYGERVGTLSITTASQEEAGRVLSQVKRVIRTTYSNPPTYGSAIVSHVLSTPALRTLWEQELNGMRERINTMRHALVEKLKQLKPQHEFDFILHQRGMFSYSGLNPQQVERLKAEFGIYATGKGRICIAALNTKNLETVAQAIAQVLN